MQDLCWLREALSGLDPKQDFAKLTKQMVSTSNLSYSPESFSNRKEGK